MTSVHLLIPAAGLGRRMGADRNKVLLTLLGKPLIGWTLLAAEEAEQVKWIGLICQEEDKELLRSVVESLAIKTPVAFIRGGDTRQASVFNGLQGLPDQAERVLIHDGARCLATADLLNRCALALDTCDGLIAAIPVKDTIKVVGADHQIHRHSRSRPAMGRPNPPRGSVCRYSKPVMPGGRSWHGPLPMMPPYSKSVTCRYRW